MGRNDEGLEVVAELIAVRERILVSIYAEAHRGQDEEDADRALSVIQNLVLAVVPDAEERAGLESEEGEEDEQDTGRRDNGPFGFGSRRGASEKAYDVDFEDRHGNTRSLSISAANKSEAKRKAREWMREEGEDVRGATFTVEAAD